MTDARSTHLDTIIGCGYWFHKLVFTNSAVLDGPATEWLGPGFASIDPSGSKLLGGLKHLTGLGV